jgi:hypothetical protein
MTPTRSEWSPSTDRRPNQNARADMARSDKGIIPRRQNCPRHRYLGYTLRFSLQRTTTRSVGWTFHILIYLFHSVSNHKRCSRDSSLCHSQPTEVRKIVWVSSRCRKERCHSADCRSKTKKVRAVNTANDKGMVPSN